MKALTKLMIVCAVMALPLSASAQNSNAEYCKALADLWRTYNRGADPSAEIATASSKCNGSPATSIPVLEKALTDDKIKLPKKM